MRYCKNCGNQVSDVATFCGRCGAPVEPQQVDAAASFGGGQPVNATGGYVGAQPVGAMGGYADNQPLGAAGGYVGNPPTNVGATPSGATSGFTPAGIISKVQGVLMLVLAGLSLFLPLIETTSLFSKMYGSGSPLMSGTGMDLSFSSNIASLLSSQPMLSKLATGITTAMNSSSSSSQDAALITQLTDGINQLGLWLTILGILLFVAMVGTFITSARCLENTTKSTLITGWLFVPYALASLLVFIFTASGINGAIYNMVESSTGEVTTVMNQLGVSSLDLLQVTPWPWVILVLAIVCGVLGIVRRVLTPRSM